jgi:hypothetical protein
LGSRSRPLGHCRRHPVKRVSPPNFLPVNQVTDLFSPLPKTVSGSSDLHHISAADAPS